MEILQRSFYLLSNLRVPGEALIVFEDAFELRKAHLRLHTASLHEHELGGNVEVREPRILYTDRIRKEVVLRDSLNEISHPSTDGVQPFWCIKGSTKLEALE